METIRTELLFKAEMEVESAIYRGANTRGELRFVPILSGKFEGSKIKGEIVSGGIDWQCVRPDKVTEIEAHYMLKTDDGVVIGVINKGFRHGTPEVMKRLATGGAVDPSEYYFRAAPIFDAPNGRYEWLNRNLFISSGERYPGKVVLYVYEVL